MYINSQSYNLFHKIATQLEHKFYTSVLNLQHFGFELAKETTQNYLDGLFICAINWVYCTISLPL